MSKIPTLDSVAAAYPIVLFDGVCNLCNSTVQFVLRRDSRQQFHFASLQSEAGGYFLNKYNLPTENFASFVLVYNNRCYRQSDGALMVFYLLGGVWRVFFFVLKWLPLWLRDGAYKIIANNRYRWFGQRETCWIPTPELKARFLT